MDSAPETHFRFPHGLPAFESDREFRLVSEPDWHPFLTMESLRPGGPRFICIEITAIDASYGVELSPEEAGMLGVAAGRRLAAEQPLRVLGIVATSESGSLTANLAAPLVLNPASGEGIQSIQPGSPYSPFTVILPGEGRERC